MTKPSAWKMAGAVSVLCAVTAIAATAQVFTTLANFEGTNGSAPFYTSLVQGPDGNLYGTTYGGGASNDGTVFKVSRQGKIISLYSFSGLDGQFPLAGLVLSNDGYFYGTTVNGGTVGAGTVFEINPVGRFAVLHSFAGWPNDGEAPWAGLVQGVNGDLYGTTADGGLSSRGSIYGVTLGGVMTQLYSFCSQNECSDGQIPEGGLALATDGNLYGMTQQGGIYGGLGDGVIFSVTPNGVLTNLLSFDYADGGYPQSTLIQAADGDLYGTALGVMDLPCNEQGCGTVFKITTSGTLTTLYTFCSQPSCADGGVPYAGLVQATDGNFYGMTAIGGTGLGECHYDNAPGCGTIFKITPGGILTTLYSFCPQTNCTGGFVPYGGLVQATDGKLYGATTYGGSGNAGTIFSLDIGLRPFVTFVRGFGKVGQTDGILGQGFRGTTSVTINGIPASFTVVSNTFIRTKVPIGATTGYVTVTSPSGTLTSNVPFHVIE